MKIQIENLKAQMQGRSLTVYQRADALIEFNKLVDYVNELEQLTISVVNDNNTVENRCECQECDPVDVKLCANCDGYCE